MERTAYPASDHAFSLMPEGLGGPVSLDWLVVRPRRGEQPGRVLSLALETKDGWRVYVAARSE